MTTSFPDPDLLAALRAAGGDPPTGAGLHRRLAERAEEEGLLDLAYRLVDSPFGPLLLAATPEGLVRVSYQVEGHDQVLARLATQVSPRILEAPARLDRAAAQLDEYFAGRRKGFDLPLDLRLATGFRLQVLEHLPTIAYGTTESYASVAAAAGRPAAVRAAAGACSHNPLPLVIPCHRVVRSDGSLGGYLGGTQVKRTLLDLEASG
ncbi:MAG: methylated-DNA--[protein]-cysteine S-methyltransferase [Acidimicrobiaceae bacterium]|nr:methylated-DNA--[protein]-cysteine S-methyltransferase [Acidimicrobiaceae bacterium]